jgi:predicted nuclease with TOPRIM domain
MLEKIIQENEKLKLVKEEEEKFETKIKKLIQENKELKEKVVELEDKLENLEYYYIGICEDCEYRSNYYEKN